MSGDVKAIDVLTGGLTYAARGFRDSLKPAKPDFSATRRSAAQELSSRQPDSKPYTPEAKERRNVSESGPTPELKYASKLLATRN